MADLAISEWIKEIKQEIHATVPLLAPLHQIGKHKWAKQLTDEVRTMREAIRVLQRIGQTRGKRMGCPPNWLQAVSAGIKEVLPHFR
jgi:hypothetical protein